ncbi:MAG: pyridoxamine kinase [Eubacteriales bacterium]|nr:pyridoxamine kinase [Oscillospiraceae bacterium]MDO4861049.1 pyridoxamine kinase [Eubacteriales bacterium]
MSYRKILTIQDISCVGQCSLTVALPILSAAGMETCILPSAVLSTHTAGFSGYTVRDLTADIPGIAAHWKKENIRFDALYTGYLGSTEQIAYVRRIAAELLSEGGTVIVDPAMADNGKLYPAFDAAYVEAMKSLAFSADIILPNITEACFLTGMEYREQYDRAYIDALLDALAACGAKTVVLTGVGFDAEHTGVIVREGGETRYYEHRKIAKGCHGTGDVYAAAFVGALENGVGAYEAAVLAADYTVRCIELTQGDAAHWYGVKFELALPEFIRMLGK